MMHKLNEYLEHLNEKTICTIYQTETKDVDELGTIVFEGINKDIPDDLKDKIVNGVYGDPIVTIFRIIK